MREYECEFQVKKCYVVVLMIWIDVHQEIEDVKKVDLAEATRQFA